MGSVHSFSNWWICKYIHLNKSNCQKHSSIWELGFQETVACWLREELCGKLPGTVLNVRHAENWKSPKTGNLKIPDERKCLYDVKEASLENFSQNDVLERRHRD